VNDDEFETLRQRLPLLRGLEERGFVQFGADGVYTIREIPLDDYTAELQNEFAIADEWSTGP
jgi:hypothetical protein